MDLFRRAFVRLWGKTEVALAGLVAAWREEWSFRQWVWLNLASVVLMLVLDVSGTERMVLIVLGLLILAAELANTAVEAVVDLVSPDPHPLAKKAKDCASAAVGVTALTFAIAWLFVLF